MEGEPFLYDLHGSSPSPSIIFLRHMPVTLLFTCVPDLTCPVFAPAAPSYEFFLNPLTLLVSLRMPVSLVAISYSVAVTSHLESRVYSRCSNASARALGNLSEETLKRTLVGVALEDSCPWQKDLPKASNWNVSSRWSQANLHQDPRHRKWSQEQSSHCFWRHSGSLF